MASSSLDGKSSKGSRKKKKNCQWISTHGSLLLLILCTVAGLVLGLALRSQNFSSHTLYLIGFPGNLIFRAFLLIMVPLLFCSLVLGVASLRKGGDAKMVAITIGFFLGLSCFSATMGAVAGHVIQPGQKIHGSDFGQNSSFTGRKGVILDSMLDLIWNAFPANIIEATFSKEYTHVEIVKNDEITNGSSGIIYKKSIQKKSGINFMGLLSFSILFGCALASLGNKGDQLYDTLEQINAVVMGIMNYFLNLLPLGMFFWMLREGLEMAETDKLFSYLGLFLATAFGCIAFHQFVLLPTLYLIIVRKNPVRYYTNLLPAILTAFGTSSSAATLPATLRCAEEVNKLNHCVCRFVLPLGMVVHMNGGTFYITLSSIFLAQLEGVILGTAETVILCLTTILLFISAPATAGGANPVYLLTAMAATGIEKPQYISFILSLEWLMERFRTVMNVVADSYVAAFVEKICKDKLPPNEELPTVNFESPVLDGYNQTSRPFTIGTSTNV